MTDPSRPAVSGPPDGEVVDTREPRPFSVLGELDSLLADASQPREHVEQALMLVEEGIRTYLDVVGVIIVALDRAGRILFVNRRGYELLGCTEDCEILGADWFEEFVPARRHAADRAVLERVWTGADGHETTLEEEVVTRDGDERLVRWTLDVLRDASGAVWAAVGTGLDITARRHSEDQLARVGQAVEAAHDGIGIIEPRGGIVYMNPALRALVGYTPVEIETAGGPHVLFPDPGAARAAFLWTMQSGTWTGEVAMRSKEGRRMIVQLRTSLIQDERGDTLGLIGVHTDVTQQKQVESALRRSEARNRALVEALPDFVVLLSRNGVIRDVAAPGASTFPLEAPAVGTPLREAFPPLLAAQLEEGIAETAGAAEAQTFFFKNDQGDYVLEARIVHIEENGVLGILRDVTERHRLEAEVLRATDEERQRLGRELHDGLGSHLVGLGMLVRSLARRARDEAPALADELQDVARLIGEGAGQARALAHGLNPVSIDRQGLPVALARLAETTNMHADLRCTCDAAADVPRLPPEVATQLYRIAQEAVTNALRHADATRIEIVLGMDDDAVVLAVDDDGRGFDGAQRPKERGLGLHTMAYRARTIGGTLDLREKPEGGITVSCRVAPPRSDEQE
jgi:two-component system sensor kinase FixL